MPFGRELPNSDYALLLTAVSGDRMVGATCASKGLSQALVNVWMPSPNPDIVTVEINWSVML